ncbi:MAG: hypothetical protein WDA16_10685 [Candidatus Thermoplasmatota archaeon]
MSRSLLALAALLLLLPQASSATEPYSVRATDDGFVIAGEEGTNPIVHVLPGSHVVLSFRNDATTPQNLHIGPPIDVETPCCQRPGEGATISFDVPPESSGRIEYWSSQRPAEAGRGFFEIGEAPPRVRFIEPEEGASVDGEVTARVSVIGTTNVTLRYALDQANVTGVTTLTTFTFLNITNGHHLLHVELVNANGTFLVPRAFDERVVFRGRDLLPTPETNSTPEPSTPNQHSRTNGLGVALVLGSIAAGAFVARRKLR